MPVWRPRRARQVQAALEPLRVCVIGAGPRFLSGISYYTHRLICELWERHSVSAIIARQLVPTYFYPGAKRVGQRLAEFRYPTRIDLCEGLDWYWGPNIVRALGLMRRQRPHVVVLQWWTGALLHSYLLLAAIARVTGAKVVLELHEVQDVGEATLPLVGAYVDALMPGLVRMTDAAVIHSEVDRAPVMHRYRLGNRPIFVIHHGPYDHYSSADRKAGQSRSVSGPFSLLYFGVIRPSKGVEDLVRAFDLLADDEVSQFSLTIVGETWEGWTLPQELIASSRYRERITFVNRYVKDDEVSKFFSTADAVVLPYHRSSASGPLHVAMSTGLPVIVSEVGGLVEAARDYEGVIFVPARSPQAIKEAMLTVVGRRGVRYVDPHSWRQTVDGFDNVFEQLGLNVSMRRSPTEEGRRPL